MNKEQAEINAKFLVESIESELKNFLQKNPIKKLETIQQKFIRGRNPLHSLVSDLIEDLERYDAREDSPHKWQEIEGRIWLDIRDFQNSYFENFLYFSTVQAFFSSPLSPIDEKYRNEKRKKYGLTPKKFQLALFETLKSLFLEEIKHGGSKGFWNDNNKLEFLALYNRFLIIIKNSRRDIKPLIKKGKSEISAKREVLAKYKIPENLIKSAFSSYDAPQEVALDWAKEEMKLNFKEEYLKDILTAARKIWRSRAIGLISQQTLKEHPKIQLILIDINFEMGCRYYAVSSINKNDMEKLKYGTVAKKLNGKMERVIGEKWDDFLVCMTV